MTTDIIKTKSLKEIRALYDEGHLESATEELLKLMNETKELEEYLGHQVLMGWIEWKRREKGIAKRYWADTHDNQFIRIKDKISAFSGFAVYYSSLETLEGDQKALEYVERIRAIIEDMDRNELFVSKNLNNVGIALSNVGKRRQDSAIIKEAEEILRAAASLNEQNEKDNEEVDTARGAMHQRAKNGYNICSLILIPAGRLEEAFEELTKEVVPRYKRVEANTDLAAAFHWISEILLLKPDRSKEDLQRAYDYELHSKKIWDRHTEDQPGRSAIAQKNLDKIKALIEAQA